MTSEEKAREARKAARANWPIWKGTWSEVPPEPCLLDTMTVEQCLAVQRELSVRSWRLTGRPVPDYDRANIPTNIIRAHEP